ncbi:MAG: STAS domain-containing protein [Treponema sp.]
MDNLKIIGTNSAKFQLLKISGAINSYTFGEFETKIFEAVKISDVVLDMSSVSHLSSSGLGVLMSANEEGEEIGHKIYILQASNAVRLAIDFTGFSDMFNFIHSIEEVNN